MKHLLFQIAAPFMSCGSPGAKQERATDSHPSKAFCLGFLGAALGKKRDDPWHDLAPALGFAVLTVRPGTRMEDYHTVATPRGTDSYPTRREEVEASDYTVETWREYLSDAYFVMAVWGDFDLDGIREALIRPTFEVFAGRKSCPLSLPPAPEILDCDSLDKAFQEYAERLYRPLKPEKGEMLLVHWEPHPNSGIKSARSYLRNDQIVDRRKRVYLKRTEHEGVFAF